MAIEVEAIREEVEQLLERVHSLEPEVFDPPDSFWAGLDEIESALEMMHPEAARMASGA